ncbi:MAG TPA: Fic family protein [Tepidisphaeraceae bacterium]|nr:Fic family protein [Tepidisphaeraceae bacterium]
MRPEDFTPGAPGQLIRATGARGEHWSFLPAPLPPDLTIDRVVATAVSEADRALGELAGVGRHVANPQMLIRPFIRREAVLSSRIEGTRADLADVYAFEAGQQPWGEDVDDVREVANYVRATEAGLSSLADGRSMSSALLRELHRVLLTGVRGEEDRPGAFRDCPVYIGSTPDLDDARFVPPPATHLADVLEAFDAYLRVPHDYPPVMRLAMLHYQFEAIHPFRDGNGRIGRLLVGLLVVHWQLLPLPLLYLSAYLERNRRAYYDHLLAVSTRGAWRDWVVFFATGIAEQARDAADRAKRLQDLHRQWRDQIESGTHVSAGLLKTVDHLFQQPLIDAVRVEKLAGVSHPTALNILRRLTQLGFIKELTGRERGQLFRADPVVQVVSNDPLRSSPYK